MAEKKSDKAGTAPAHESVADYARREMAEVAERERKKKVYLEGQKRAATEVPERFLAIAADVRREIDAFNQIVDPSRRITLQESAGLAARAEAGRAELNFSAKRKNVEAWVGLSELMRLGQTTPAYIIDGQIRLSKSSLRLRAEAIPSGDGLRYRIMLDGMEQKYPLEELGSRLVLALAKDDPTPLGGVLVIG